MIATRDDLIADAVQLIPLAARKFRCPPGLSTEDLESSGNEALLDAATRYDPGEGIPWKKYAYVRLKGAMQNTIRLHRRRPTVTLQPEFDGQAMPPPVDPRAADPAALAQTRELVERQRPRLSVRQMEAVLPSPGQVADQVTRLRAAMFGAVSEQDVAEVMGAVLKRAKAGDLKAVKLVTDLLAPGRSGVTVNQQAVVIRTGDLD